MKDESISDTEAQPQERECPGCVAAHAGSVMSHDLHDEQCKAEHREPSTPTARVPKSEDATGYNAAIYQEVFNDVIAPAERARIQKLEDSPSRRKNYAKESTWQSQLIHGLVQRIMNLRLMLAATSGEAARCLKHCGHDPRYMDNGECSFIFAPCGDLNHNFLCGHHCEFPAAQCQPEPQANTLLNEARDVIKTLLLTQAGSECAPGFVYELYAKGYEINRARTLMKALATRATESATDGEDKARLDWLNDFIQGGYVEMAVELDGGINMRLSAMGCREPLDLRDQNSIRDAIDNARKSLPSPPETAK